MPPTLIRTTPLEQALAPTVIPETKAGRGGPPAVRAGPPPEQGIRAAWRALGDSRALIAGAAVLVTAVVFGAAETGIVGILVYRLLRRRPPVTFSAREGVGELAESTLRKVGQALVAPASAASLAIWTVEIGSVAYFVYRMAARRRVERRDIAQLTGSESGP